MSEKFPLRIVALGTVSPHKRFDRVIERVGAVRRKGIPVKLSVWGPTPDRAEALRLRRLGLSVLGDDPLRGPVPPHDRAYLFRQADVLAVGSAYESFGMVIVEALRTSTAVWAPACALIDELCDSSALTFGDDDDSDAAAKVLIGGLPNIAAIAQAGMERSLRFDWENCVRDTLAHILDVSG